MNKLICIICPRGCHLEVDENFNVTGNFCKRGEIYAKKELTSPERTITSTIKVLNGDLSRVSVSTSKPIPKELIHAVMNEIKKCVLLCANCHREFHTLQRQRNIPLKHYL